MSKVHKEVERVLLASQRPMTIPEIEAQVRYGAGQTHFDRRVRELRRWYELEIEQSGHGSTYRLGKKRDQPLQGGSVNPRTRALVLMRAAGRCEMCGRTAAEDGVKFEVDHRLPLSLGGGNEIENLWALCRECNQGKKNLFSSVESEPVKRALAEGNIHRRLGEFLKAFHGEDVPKARIDAIASSHDDWEKRLRDLRMLGWQFETLKKKEETGKVAVFYRLTHWEPWPEDPSGAIRAEERRRAAEKKNQAV